jgi:Leucine-rich repeat (LRR) protein/GTPase SAR1 family protein
MVRQSGSVISEKSNKSHESKNKDATKQRIKARRLKLESQMAEVDIGHEVVLEIENSSRNDSDEDTLDKKKGDYVNSEKGFPDSIDPFTIRSISTGTNETRVSAGLSSQTSANSVASDSSSLQGSKTSGSTNQRATSGNSAGGGGGGSSVLFGKSSSLIFPTGVEASSDAQDQSYNLKRHKINMLLDACENVRFPFKKKLILNSLNLTAADIPIRDLYRTSLGNSLHKLSLAGNRLSTIPPKLISCLPVLKTLDLSQCELHNIPERWNLPQLKRLNLSHNRLVDFPEEPMLEGLLELHELNMYGNKVSDITVPQNPRLLSKLEILNLGYNDLSYIPDDLDRLKALRTFKAMHNLLEKIPMRVCDMDLKNIDVSSNPVLQPPIETCERGIGSMKRYYHCIRMEDKSKAKLHAGQESKTPGRQNKKSKIGFGIPSITKSRYGRKNSDDLSQQFPPGVVGDIRRASSAVVTTVGLPKVAQAPRTTFDGFLPESTHSCAMKSTPEVGSGIRSPESTQDEITVNDTLKVIFVGMAMVGKTSMIKRLIEGEGAVIPKRDDRTVGVDIYEWDPKIDRRYEHIDTRIELGDKEERQKQRGDVNVKFSVWDFAGQHVYHATHELFFSQRALYVLVWDMGATNPATRQRKTNYETNKGSFSLSYDSDEESDEEESGNFTAEEEARRAERALERDIDEKVQFWVDCIQSSAPGAAILPVASFDDYFESDGGQEAKRRCNILKERLLRHEDRRIQGIKDRLKEYCDQNRAHDEAAQRLRKLLSSYTRPKLIFGNEGESSVLRVSGTKYTGFSNLTQRVIDIATGRDKCNMRFPIFRGHVGARIPRMRLEVREAVRRLRDRFKVVEWGYFLSQLRDNGLTNVEDISDALHFLANIGELSYFGNVVPGQGIEQDGMEENVSLLLLFDLGVIHRSSSPFSCYIFSFLLEGHPIVPSQRL